MTENQLKVKAAKAEIIRKAGFLGIALTTYLEYLDQKNTKMAAAVADRIRKSPDYSIWICTKDASATIESTWMVTRDEKKMLEAFLNKTVKYVRLGEVIDAKGLRNNWIDLGKIKTL